MTKRTKIILITLSGALVLTGCYFAVKYLIIQAHYKNNVTEDNAIEIINKEVEKIDESEIDYKALGVDTENETKTGVTLDDNEDTEDSTFWNNPPTIEN